MNKFFDIFKEGLLSRYTTDNPNMLVLAAILTLIGIVAVSYLLGSINSAIIISRLLYRDDVRKHGSGNAGTTNMLRTYGKGAAALTLIGDILKAAISVLIGLFFMAVFPGGYFAAFFCMLGHIFPVYYKFRGGKGVLCAAVAMAILSPIPFLICFAIFVLIVAVTRFVSLGSVVASLAYPLVLANMTGYGWHVIFGFVMAALIAVMHKSNLKRIMEKKEAKLSFKKKPRPTEEQKSDDGSGV